MEGLGSAPNDTNARLPPTPPPRTPRRETHRVLYDFVGQNENEVTLKRGEHVLITQGDTNGWSLVKMEAGVGWAPSEYLTELETEALPTPRSPAPSSTTSSGTPPPPPLPRCDPCKRDAAECKRSSDVCDRCTEQGLLCEVNTRKPPPPPACQGYGRSARTMFANEIHEKPQTCIACGVRVMTPDEDFCSRCKSKGIKPAEYLPTSCYIPETEPPLGSWLYKAMKAASAVRACHTCYFAKIKCDEGKPGCSNCKERNVRCKYSRLLDFANPLPEVGAAGESSKAASVSSNSNAMRLPPLSTPSEPGKSKCITCQHRRVKCDEGLPNCARCIRAGRECVYEESVQLPRLQAFPLRPTDLLAAAAGSHEAESHAQSFGDSSAARGPRDIIRERQASYTKGADHEAKAAVQPSTQFNELHLVCGPCRNAGAHCIGFPSHTCKRCNDNNIECEITLRPAITDRYRDSDTSKKAGPACDNCRRFQTYCDKAMPACSYCEPRTLRCSYRDDTRRERNVASPGTERESLRPTLLRYKRADGKTSDPAPFNNKPADEKSEKAAESKSPGIPDAQGLKEQDRDGDEWEMVDEPELEEEIDIVVVECEPQSTGRHVEKQNSESDSQFEKMAKKIRSDLDSWSHAADQPKLARWSAKDGDITYEGYIVNGVILKSNQVDPEIVKNQAKLESDAEKEKSELNSQNAGLEKKTPSDLGALGHAAADRLNLVRVSGEGSRSTCEGYNLLPIIEKNERVDPAIVANRARLDRIR